MQLRGIPLPVANETEMQDALETQLKSMRLPFRREVKLDAASRIDFLLFDSIGVEVKTRCPKRQIHRQLSRYAESPRIHALILVSATFTGLPKELNQKPLYFVHAGRAAL